MTLNSHFALKSVSGSATNGLASSAFGQNWLHNCRATHILSATQKCSPGNVVSGSIRFMQIFAGVRWEGASNVSGVVENCDFRFIRSLSSEHGHTTAFRWYDCQWPLAYFKVIGLFRIKFLKNGVWYGKSYYWQLIGNHTLAFDWCHFWWPWILTLNTSNDVVLRKEVPFEGYKN